MLGCFFFIVTTVLVTYAEPRRRRYSSSGSSRSSLNSRSNCTGDCAKIVGISLGAVLGVGLIVGIALLIYFIRRKKRLAAANALNTSTYPQPVYGNQDYGVGAGYPPVPGASGYPSSTMPYYSRSLSDANNYVVTNDVPNMSFQYGQVFCDQNPPVVSHKFSDMDMETIRQNGPTAWSFAPVDATSVLTNEDGTQVVSFTQTPDKITTILTNFPLFQTHNRSFYFEVTMKDIGPGASFAGGLACRPYPQFRLPGWHRLSAALHTMDGCKYYEDNCGGSECTTPFVAGDVMGIGYDMDVNGIYFTKNGERMDANEYDLTGVFEDVTGIFPAIGASGQVVVEVNFGSKPFRYSTKSGFELR